MLAKAFLAMGKPRLESTYTAALDQDSVSVFRSFDRFTAHTAAFLKRRPVFFCGQDGGLICIRADNE